MPGVGAFGGLAGVAAISADDVWAVGSTGSGALILHWDGRKWSPAKLPSLSPGSSLDGVAGTSARNVWAVGNGGSDDMSLILHWNGKAWKRLPGRCPLTAIARRSPPWPLELCYIHRRCGLSGGLGNRSQTTV